MRWRLELPFGPSNLISSAGIVIEVAGFVLATVDVLRSNQRTIDALRATNAQAVEIARLAGEITASAITVSDGAGAAVRIHGAQAALQSIKPIDLTALPLAFSQRHNVIIGAALVLAGVSWQFVGALIS